MNWKIRMPVPLSPASAEASKRDTAAIVAHSVADASDSDLPQGKLDLLLSSVKVLPAPGCFCVISPSKAYTLRAVTDYERDKRDEWMAVIQNNIAHLLAIGGDAVRTEQSSDQVVPQSLACNATCADCGAPAPTWTALNWSVCVCIHCCAAHRRMGASVSKPRSLTLDRLPDAALRILEIIGNERANAVLEEGVGEAKITDRAVGRSRVTVTSLFDGSMRGENL
jgi:hypothetical protein